MKVVYIAGPFRAKTGWEIELNVRAAEAVAVKVWGAEMAALCPHANSRHYHGVESDEVFLEGTLEFLRRSDAVLLVKGWEESQGTLAEIKEAERLRIPVFRTLFELVDWNLGRS